MGSEAFLENVATIGETTHAAGMPTAAAAAPTGSDSQPINLFPMRGLTVAAITTAIVALQASYL